MILSVPLLPHIYQKFEKQRSLVYSADLNPAEAIALRLQYRIYLFSLLNELSGNPREYARAQRQLANLDLGNRTVSNSVDDLLGLFPNSEKVHLALAYCMLAHEEMNYVAGVEICPYYIHSVQVVQILVNELGVYDERIAAAALLHDVLEKGKKVIDIFEIKEKFDNQIATAVDVLTIWRPQEYQSRYRQIREDRGFAPVIALADRLNHLRNLRYLSNFSEDFICRTAGEFIEAMENTDNNYLDVYLLRRIKRALEAYSYSTGEKEQLRFHFLDLIYDHNWIEAMNKLKDYYEFLPLFEETTLGVIHYELQRDRHFVYLTAIKANGKEIRLYQGY